jgi:hypothetical protein
MMFMTVIGICCDEGFLLASGLNSGLRMSIRDNIDGTCIGAHMEVSD